MNEVESARCMVEPTRFELAALGVKTSEVTITSTAPRHRGIATKITPDKGSYDCDTEVGGNCLTRLYPLQHNFFACQGVACG